MKRITVPEEGIETLFGSYDENLKHLESLSGSPQGDGMPFSKAASETGPRNPLALLTTGRQDLYRQSFSARP